MGLETGTDLVSRAFVPWLTCAPDTTLAKHVLTHGIIPLSRLRPLPAEFTRWAPLGSGWGYPCGTWSVSSLPCPHALWEHTFDKSSSRGLHLGSHTKHLPYYFQSLIRTWHHAMYLFTVPPLPLEYRLHEGRDLTYLIPCGFSCLEGCLVHSRHPEYPLLNKWSQWILTITLWGKNYHPVLQMRRLA